MLPCLSWELSYSLSELKGVIDGVTLVHLGPLEKPWSLKLCKSLRENLLWFIFTGRLIFPPFPFGLSKRHIYFRTVSTPRERLPSVSALCGGLSSDFIIAFLSYCARSNRVIIKACL